MSNKLYVVLDNIFNYIRGDDRLDVICHGANTCHTMGAGFAKIIRNRIPEMYLIDRARPQIAGSFSFVMIGDISDHFRGYNLYTQVLPGPEAKLEYIQKSFSNMLNDLESSYRPSNKRHEPVYIGFPAIGCGIGGLEVADVSEVILDTVSRFNDHPYNNTHYVPIMFLLPYREDSTRMYCSIASRLGSRMRVVDNLSAIKLLESKNAR